MKIFIYSLFFILSASAIYSQEFYDHSKLHNIEIIFPRDNWDEILHSFKKQDNGRRMTATLKIDGIKYDSVGVRYKGNSSYYSVRNHEGTKLPFNIKLDYKIEDQSIPGGYEKIKLSNIFRDPSYVREALSYEIARKYMDAPKAGFAKVTVNGKYLGIYNVVEAIDSDYVTAHFGDENTLIKCDALSYKAIKEAKLDKTCGQGEYSSLMYLGDEVRCYKPFYELKTDDELKYKGFVNMIKTLNKTPDKIEEVLDVDQTLWMLAFNNVLVNLDSYTGRLSHNYYFYQKDNGQFMPLVWDLNLSFGGFRYLNDSQPLTNEELKRLSMFAHYKNEKRPLISKILSVDLYRKMYVAYIKTIIDENFTNGWYKTAGEKMRGSIDYAVKNEKNALYPYDAFKKNFSSEAKADKASMIGLVELMEGRMAYLKDHPLMQKTAPVVGKPLVSKAGNTATISVSVQNATNVFIYYETLGKKRQRIEMSSEDSNNFKAEILTEGKKTEYFIVAEAEKTATVMPTKGGKMPFKI